LGWRQWSAALPGGARFLTLWGTVVGTLAPRPTAVASWHRRARRQRHRYIRGRPPAAGPSPLPLTPPNLRLSTL
jgi:hypothetical protein